MDRNWKVWSLLDSTFLFLQQQWGYTTINEEIILFNSCCQVPLLCFSGLHLAHFHHPRRPARSGQADKRIRAADFIPWRSSCCRLPDCRNGLWCNTLVHPSLPHGSWVLPASHGEQLHRTATAELRTCGRDACRRWRAYTYRRGWGGRWGGRGAW